MNVALHRHVEQLVHMISSESSRQKRGSIRNNQGLLPNNLGLADHRSCRFHFALRSSASHIK